MTFLFSLEVVDEDTEETRAHGGLKFPMNGSAGVKKMSNRLSAVPGYVNFRIDVG